MLILGSAVVLLGTLYYIADPLWRFMPRCMFHDITGYQCPGCGAQRMLHALMHADVAAAWHYNPFLMVAIPFILLLLVTEIYRTRVPRLYNALHSIPAIIITSVAIAAWTIFRNL